MLTPSGTRQERIMDAHRDEIKQGRDHIMCFPPMVCMWFPFQYNKRSLIRRNGLDSSQFQCAHEIIMRNSRM